jgi:hypothetical protein
LDVYINGDLAFVSDPDFGTEIIDISDPENPTVIGSITENTITGVIVTDTLLFATGSPVLQIYDITDISNPSPISSYPGYWRGDCLKIQGNYAFIANTYDGLTIIDISETQNPILFYEFTEPSYGFDLVVLDNKIVMTDIESNPGLWILGFLP